MLKAKELVKSFGGVKALDRVSFELEENEILGVIGPNGSGKTTLFNVISGFLKANHGQVIFMGKDITGDKAHRICDYGLTRVFQLVHPFPGLTTIQNVMAGRICGKRSARTLKDAQRDADEILQKVGLSKKRDMVAGNLSLPDRKRLEVARALATRPRLLMLDEVMAGLNPRETEEALELLREINSTGIALIVVEHNVKAILGISTKIIVLNVGGKIAEGTPEQISSNERVVEAYFGKKAAS
jgi:branched-chain amino acid transport system ATP-binding protein